jgi:hypothetical protein
MWLMLIHTSLWSKDFDFFELEYCHGPEYLELAAREYSEGKYIDVHYWVFTPWHFLKMMGLVCQKLGVSFDLQYFLTTQKHDLEFYIQLKKVETVSTDWLSEARKARASDIHRRMYRRKWQKLRI